MKIMIDVRGISYGMDHNIYSCWQPKERIEENNKCQKGSSENFYYSPQNIEKDKDRSIVRQLHRKLCVTLFCDSKDITGKAKFVSPRLECIPMGLIVSNR